MFRLKNSFLRIGVIVILIGLLAACGNTEGQGSTNQPTPEPTVTGTPPAAEEAQTKEYTDALGRKVTIPLHAQRILTTQYLPEALAVGIKPVGAASHLLTGFASIKDQLAGIEDIGQSNDLNLEKALELQPDLIIATEWNQEQLDHLSQIAPTVVVQWAGQDAFAHFKTVADVLGQNDKADQWIADFDKKAEEARTKLAAYVGQDETFGVVVIGGYEKGQLRLYGNGNVGYTLFDQLKFPMTDTVRAEWEKEPHDLGLNISLEKLPEFASADRLFLVKFDNDPEFVGEVENSSLWKNLPAVKNNKVYVVQDDLWFSYDVQSFSAQLDDAVTLLGQK